MRIYTNFSVCMALSGIFFSSVGQAAVFRCAQADGTILYQDAPCAGGEQREIKPATAAPPPLPPGAVPAYKLEAAALEQRTRIREAIADGIPMVGMTRRQLVDALGRPDRVNTGLRANSIEQWVYPRRGRTWYVYLAGELVESVSDSPGSTMVSAPRIACPDGNERRKIEIDASNVHERLNKEFQRRLRERQDVAAKCAR